MVVRLLFCLKTREVETHRDIWTSQDNIIKSIRNDSSDVLWNLAMLFCVIVSARVAERNTRRTVKQ